MTSNPTSGSSSIFKGGKLKPGIYKIQNINTETYLDVEVHTREVCCRPAKDLGEGRGLWEIKRLGAGYTVRRVDPGKPEQFCTALKGTSNGTTLRVTPYPVAWNIKIVNDQDNHRGFEYVRFYWGTEKIAWDLAAARKDNGSPVQTYVEGLNHTWQIWRLIPVEVKEAPAPLRSSLETLELGSLPSYEGDAGQSSTRTQHTELECDELGTVVNEVTVVTTTATTRKRYRVEGA